MTCSIEQQKVPCPVCVHVTGSHPSVIKDPGGVDRLIVKGCSFCGDFCISGSALNVLRTISDEDRLKISHYLRKQRDVDVSMSEINTDILKAIVKLPLPRPREQADLLIRHIAELSADPGKTVTVAFKSNGAFIGAKSIDGFRLIADHLANVELITIDWNAAGSNGRVRLTFSGWEKYEELRLGKTNYRKAFMAMEYGHPVLDSIVDNEFKKNARLAGFDLFRLIEKPKAGLIDDHIRAEIQASEFIVADLTHKNNGSYWEAGYAEGLGKPVIYTCEVSVFNKESSHFDTNHHTTILWNEKDPTEAGKQLKDTIRASLPHLAIMHDE